MPSTRLPPLDLSGDQAEDRPTDRDNDLLFPVRLPPMVAFTRAVSPNGKGPKGARKKPTPDPTPGNGGNGNADEGHGGGSLPPPRRPKPKSRARGWLMLTLLGTAALGVLAVAARKDIARELAEGWLGRQGIPAEIHIERLSLKRVTGHAVIGLPEEPDLVLKDFSVDYELSLFKAGLPLARIKQITLNRPELSFTYDDKGLHLGTLQPFLERTSPDDSQSAPPDIILIRDARITAHTAYGRFAGTGDAHLSNGRLKTADITLKPADLNGARAQGQLTSGKVHLRTVPDAQTGEALQIQAELSADTLSLISETTDPTVLNSIRADLDARLPYRDKADALFDGPLKATLGVRAGGITSPALKAKQLEAHLSADGTLADNISAFAGQSHVALRAQSLDSDDISTRDLYLSSENLSLEARLSDNAPTLQITGPVKGSAGDFTQGSLRLQNTDIVFDDFTLGHADERTDIDFAGRARSGRFVQNDLSLNRLDATVKGEAHIAPETGFTARIDTDLRSPDARYTGLADAARKRASDLAASREAANLSYQRALATATPDAPPVPLPPDSPDVMVSLSRAVERFSLEARGAQLIIDDTGFDLRLKQPARLIPATGGRILVTPLPNRPIVSSQRTGALNLSLTGGDLPETTARVSDITLLANGAVRGRFNAQSRISFAPLYGADLKMNGLFHYSASGTLIDLGDCIDLRADRADIGGRLTDVTGRICRAGAPLVSLTPDGQWRAQGTFTGLKGDAPDYQARLSEGNGRFTARSLPDGLAFTVGLETLRAEDALEAPRFHPVGIKGNVEQDARTLNGRLYVSPYSSAVLTRAPDPIATIDITSDVRTGVGRADITADNLTFTPDGLQPLDLTPAVAGVATRDVSGSIDFKGHFGWHKDGGDSGGILTLKGIDFNGPLGQANGLRGEMTFTSLAPLASDPGQSLRLDRFMSVIPLSDIDANLQFFGDYVTLERADVTTPGGHVLLDPMDVPFDSTKGFTGALRFERLNFGQVISATDFGRDMKFEGTVSGRVPFALSGDGTFQFDKGELKGDGPGRISISRTALQGSADGSATATPESGNLPVQAVEGTAIENMAYQALENLAYENLEASIASLDNGRLGFNFRIKGNYDPPEKKEARIGIIDYLRGTWATKPIDLPSGTGVDLHLGMTLNLDQLLQDLADFDRLKSGQTLDSDTDASQN